MALAVVTLASPALASSSMVLSLSAVPSMDTVVLPLITAEPDATRLQATVAL